MPSTEGRRAQMRRLLRRHGRSALRHTPIVSVVAALAIVGAIGSQIAVLARTPSIEDTGLSLDTTTTSHARLLEPVVGLLAVVPTIGVLDVPEPRSPAPLEVPMDPLQPRMPSLFASSSSLRSDPPRVHRQDRRSKPAHERDRKPQPARPQPRRERVHLVGRSRWHVAPSASYYGPGLYGNTTACGQRFTRSIVGVAHRTLPCGTLVQLRWQGQTAVVPVIDRGPFGAHSNVFDLSRRLACVVLRPGGARDGCFTRHHVRWRIVDRRRS